MERATATTSCLSLGQLSLATRLPREWLRGEADSGRIPCLRVGQRYVFNLRAVERALSERAAEKWCDHIKKDGLKSC